MALRVLLADESSTIKKVIQLALQDYGVQVKTVNVGADALDVIRTFQPDIVFADILLQKKSGYDVCQEIKKDPTLSKTPVVLMWSGFLELDSQQFHSSRADDQLEKPFNVETLRNLIRKWVPKLETQGLSQFIDLPASVSSMTVESEAPPPQAKSTPRNFAEELRLESIPNLTQSKAKIPAQSQSSVKTTEIPASPPAAPTQPESNNDWNMDSFEDIGEFVLEEASPIERHLEVIKLDDDKNEFSEMALTDLGPAEEEESPATVHQLPKSEPEGDEPWLTQDLSKFKLDIPDEDDEMEVMPVQRIEEAQTSSQMTHSFAAELELSAPQASPRGQSTAASGAGFSSGTIPKLSADEIEKILRAQSKDIIEAVVWKIVPEMAGTIIREELDRLLREEEAL